VVVLRGELQHGGDGEGPAPVESLYEMRNRVNALTVGLALARWQQQLGLAADAEASFRTLEREVAALAGQVDAVARWAPPLPGRHRRALLVEDDRNQRELLAGFLRLAGVEVDAVEDGADALDWLHSRDRPDVLLCDMALPRCDGPTVVRTLRRDPVFSRLKIFGVTGRRPGSFGLKDGPGGVDRWFRKPLDPAALLAEIDRELTGVPATPEETPARP
jgi:CheY-like chemotaxis protein